MTQIFKLVKMKISSGNLEKTIKFFALDETNHSFNSKREEKDIDEIDEYLNR